MRYRKNVTWFWLVLMVLSLDWSPAWSAENVGRFSRIYGGKGPHIIGIPNRESSDSHVAITGSFGDNTSGDNRALGITTLITTNPVGGGRSSEVINLRPSFTLPSSGNIATIEGLHVDFSGAWGPYGNGNLWQSGTSATVGSVHAIRVRGVTMPAGAQTYSALTIDAGFGGPGAVANYNIFSNGATARNRFDGYLEVYGMTGHIIGGGGSSVPYVGLLVDPVVTDNTGGIYGSALMRIGWSGGSVSPPATQNGYGLIVAPTLIEAASGVHPDFVGAQFNPLQITDGAGSVNNATTVKIIGAPTAGTLLNFALWIDNQGTTPTNGLVRWDDPIALGGGAAPTFGSIGGSGPATAGQARWLRVNVDGTPSFIPVWQ